MNASQRQISRAAHWAALVLLASGALGGLGRSSPLLAEVAVTATEPLQIMTAKGPVSFNVEVAATPAQQTVGLMYRTQLADTGGMLFLHGAPREVTMWMRNTYIPLDMLFITSDGTIHRIEAMTEPLSEDIIASKGPVAAVLELAGGAAARLGIKAGDKVRHRHFPSAP